MKPLIKEEDNVSPFTGFDKIYDLAIDHAIKVVRETYLSIGNSPDGASILFIRIEKELMKLKSTNQ